MPKTRVSVSASLALRPNLESPLQNPEVVPTVPDWKEEEPWMAILVEELNNSFRIFAKESGRLSRLVQAKKKCSIPSEGFNLQVTMRMECVERAFHTYMRRKDELLSYILATAYRVQRRSGSPAQNLPAKPNSGVRIEPKNTNLGPASPAARASSAGRP